MTRPRAADDFPAIRARIEELRRARARVSADKEPRPPIGPRPYALQTRPAPRNTRLSPGASRFLRRLFRTA
jgi:hypothetical protein